MHGFSGKRCVGFDRCLQLLAVDSATPRALMGSGKISPMRTQDPGPQVLAKKNMKMQMKAIMTESETAECVVVPMMATVNWQIAIPQAPQRKRGRRPNLSIVQKEIGVENTLTSVVTRDIKNGSWMVPRSLKLFLLSA